MQYKQRTLLVTGASRGIGKAISRNLLHKGMIVVGIARRFNGEETSSSNFITESLDLSKLDRLPQQLQAISERYPEIDGIVCSAGYGRFGSLEEFSPQQIRSLIDLNLTSQILLTRVFMPMFKRRGEGDLIFIGSEAALSGSRKGAVYCATKFALRGLTQSLREECSSSGVRVSIINPGMVSTSFFESLAFAPGVDDKSHLLAEDIAEAVWLILSARPGTVIDEINLSPQKKVIQFKPKPWKKR